MPKKTISMMRNLHTLPISCRHWHLTLYLNPSFPFLKGLILKCPMQLFLSILASHAALHPRSKALTRARCPRMQLLGVLLCIPCQCYILSQEASNFLVLLHLLTWTLCGRVVLAILKTHSPLSGVIHHLLLGLVPISLSWLHHSRVCYHAVHFSVPSNLLLLYWRAWPLLTHPLQWMVGYSVIQWAQFIKHTALLRQEHCKVTLPTFGWQYEWGPKNHSFSKHFYGTIPYNAWHGNFPLNTKMIVTQKMTQRGLSLAFLFFLLQLNGTHASRST